MSKGRFTRYDFVACDNSLRQAHDMIYGCCVRQKKCRSMLRADLHDTILSHATKSYRVNRPSRAHLHGTIFVACDKPLTGLRHDLRLACTSEKCRSILKHVLKRWDNLKSCRRPVVSLSRATKIVPCKSALRRLRRIKRHTN